MIFYLTYNDLASGVYSSQVVDSCKEFSKISKQKVKIISFIPLRSFFKERGKLKLNFDKILILPAFPKMKYYKMNLFVLILLSIYYRPTLIICRNSIPTKLGLMLRKLKLIKKVIFDARAAEYEQFIEYKLSIDMSFISEIFNIEKEAVNFSDYKIAVSDELVKYWKKTFNYSQLNHVVIPCTLNSDFYEISKNVNLINRQSVGYSNDDIILIYSGSVSQWQSFDLLISFFEEQLMNNQNIKIIFLCKKSDVIDVFKNKYPNRVKQLWCKEYEVFNYLSIADYGMLLRENTWTNKVSSPVKFAEYLSAGLDIIISDSVGDYSQMVVEKECGFIFNKQYIELKPIDNIKREKNKKLVDLHFYKKSDFIIEKYTTLFKI